MNRRHFVSDVLTYTVKVCVSIDIGNATLYFCFILLYVFMFIKVFLIYLSQKKNTSANHIYEISLVWATNLLASKPEYLFFEGKV